MIIGFVGKVGSGKDTVAKMLDYIIFKDVVSNKEATYEKWRSDQYEDMYTTCFAFGDNVKKVVSVLYGIPIRYLYNRDYKDNYYYCLSSGTFSYKSEIRGCKVIHDLNKDNIDLILKPNVYFRLRHLLQFVGTDLCKNQLGNNIWINATLNGIKCSGVSINTVTDIRFQDEADAIINYEAQHFIIKVVNTAEFENNKSEHASEDVDNINSDIVDQVVKWNGTIDAALFLVVKDIYYTHIKPKMK